jgi:NAD(P)-dependent dehydrogenase (short-subunit alcohol dehydrogenase family)
MPGDIQHPAHCRKIVEKAKAELGGIDILVNKPPIRQASSISPTSRTRSGS